MLPVTVCELVSCLYEFSMLNSSDLNPGLLLVYVFGYIFIYMYTTCTYQYMFLWICHCVMEYDNAYIYSYK